MQQNSEIIKCCNVSRVQHLILRAYVRQRSGLHLDLLNPSVDGWTDEDLAIGLSRTYKVPANFLSEAHARKAKMCANLLHKHLPEHFPEPAEMVLVFMQGAWWVLVDVTLRMLTPRELARAQGFPDDYVIEPMVRRCKRAKGGRGRKKGWSQDKEWELVPLSKSAQVRMIGNSVCPPLARALIEANFATAVRLAKVA